MKSIVIIAMLMSLFGGGKPAGEFKYYEYRCTSMREYPREYYKLERTEENGVTLSWAKRNSDITVLRVSDEAAGKVDAMVDEYKLQNLKNLYQPPFRVLDGFQWSLYIRYDKGGISSGGDNAWPGSPQKEGIKAVNAYLDTLIEASGEEDIIEVKSYWSN